MGDSSNMHQIQVSLVRLFILVPLIFNAKLLHSQTSDLYVASKNNRTITLMRFDPDNGTLTKKSSFDLPGSPSMMQITRDKNNLVVLHTQKSKKKSVSYLQTVHLNTEGGFTKASKPMSFPHSGYFLMDRNNNYLIARSYKGKLLTIHKIENGRYTGKQLAEHKTAQSPHDLGFSRDQKLFFVPHNKDNVLYQYKFRSKNGVLTPCDPPHLQGIQKEKHGYANTRSLAMHPLKNVFYCSYESGGGVSSWTYSENGAKLWQNFSTTKKGKVSAPSTLALSPGNDFLYVINRHNPRKHGLGKNYVTGFKIDKRSGKILSQIQILDIDATNPRHIFAHPDQSYMFITSTDRDSLFTYLVQKNGNLKQLKEYKVGGSWVEFGR